MSIKRLKDLPDGSGSLSNDDIFLFMDDPSGSGITKKISLSEIGSAIGGGGGGGISNIVEDTTPQLGGDLDLNNNNIIGTGNIDINGSGDFTYLSVNNTSVSLSGHTHTSSNITDFNSSVSGLLPVKNIIGSGNINVSSSNQIFTVSSSGISNILEDTTPQLGGNLDLNSYSINGTGSLSVSGSGNFNSLAVNNISVSISGHSHIA